MIDVDEAEWLEDIEKRNSSLKSFLAIVEESTRRKLVEGLNS